MATFSIGDADFLLDGQPHRILSGALHYFRVHPDQWADRIEKARLMGLNTIETYVAWNAHSPERGRFDTSGGLDLGRFLDLVADAGMHAIVRPGPYICAEWDDGGLPGWLLAIPDVGLRRSEPAYLAAIAEYFAQVLPIVAARQVDRGGPVILVQIENEYGAYGSDAGYLRALVDLTRQHGITVPLTTIDQPSDRMLEDGSIPGLHKTGSFGSAASARLATLRRHQPTGPLMCAEFWDGWFDSWGLHHHTTSTEASAAELETLLAAGASVNIYMFHGGTNFGFSNGANDKGVYVPITTSYDYDAPLDEAGHPTAKYWAFRDVISRYSPVPDATPAERRPAPVMSVAMSDRMLLWDALPHLGPVVGSDRLPTFDDLGHHRGFALYSIEVASGGLLSVAEVRDRAQVFHDRVGVGMLERERHDTVLPIPDAAGVLDILVEDLGGVNYGPRIGEAKGLIGPATVDGVPLTGWTVRPLLLDDVTALSAVLDAEAGRTGAVSGPSFVRGRFEADGSDDLHLSTVGWGKGVAWVNGFCLGRYWSRGPQATLFVPAPALREGANELMLFELTGSSTGSARFVAHADLGHTEQ